MSAGLVVDALLRRRGGFALGPLSLHLEPGRSLGLLGANGAGKTTLLAGIAGQGRLNGGTVTWNAHPIVRGDWRLREQVAFVRDVPALYGELSVRQTLSFVGGVYRTWQPARAAVMLDLLRLDAAQRVSTLSRGMRAKLALLLAVSHGVELLLLDEVTAGVDADTRAEIQRLIRTLGRERRVAAILSSHIFEDVEHACDDVLILRAGQAVFHGPLDRQRLPSLRDLYSLPEASDVQPLIALVTKDCLLHWRSVALFCVGFIALAHALMWILPPLPQPGLALPPVLTVPAVLSFVMTCVTWLVDRERSRETFALLRALPLSDLHIVGSKYLTYLLMQLAGLAFVVATTPVGAYLSPIQVATAFMAILAFASLCLAAQLSFSHRKAAVAPVILLLVLAASAMRVGHSQAIVRELARRWREPWLHVSLWAACLGVVLVCLLATCLRFRSQDTQDLIG